MRHGSTPSTTNREGNYRNPVDAVIRRALELFSEHIGIDFFIGVIAASPFQARTQGRDKLVDAVDDRRAGVKKQRAAGIEAIDTFPHDPHRELEPKVPAAVAVEPRG